MGITHQTSIGENAFLPGGQATWQNTANASTVLGATLPALPRNASSSVTNVRRSNIDHDATNTNSTKKKEEKSFDSLKPKFRAKPEGERKPKEPRDKLEEETKKI